jgi:SAM-dependent methyltransferase
MKFPPMELALKYCKGQGVELGGASHNPFYLERCLNMAPSDGVGYVFEQDLKDYQFYAQSQQGHCEELLPVDLVGDFQNIPLADNTLDYIVSSHVIEHEPNLIAALIESYRVLKNNGIFFCVFPKRMANPTDSVFPLTTLEKFIYLYENKASSFTLTEEAWRTHYCFFSLQSMINVINYMNKEGLAKWYIECCEETDSKVGNGHTIVLRKRQDLINPLLHEDFDGYIDNAIANKEYKNSLILIKSALSYGFFNARHLYAAAVLSISLNDCSEGVEYIRQALVVDPEDEYLRKEFFRLTGFYYVNPVL